MCFKNRLLFIFLVSSMLLIGCKEDKAWLNERIETFKSKPVGNPPAEIWKYDYKGKLVYYFIPQCCDMMSELVDENGEKICSPDGGITGRGDGKCTDFFEMRKNEELVWKDTR